MNDNLLNATQNWLDRFVIQYSICPFARRERQNQTIRFQLLSGNSLATHLESLILEAEYLDDHPETETTLIIFSAAYEHFDDFLDMLAIADDLLIAEGYEGIYQLASFHPAYCFADADIDDAANYTNRSPAPMLHLIREASIEQVLQNYPDPEQIPERNVRLTRELGNRFLEQLLAGCQQVE